MVHFLRDNKGKTIIETECYIKTDDWKYIEVSSSVDITNYSNFLLSNPEKSGLIIERINELDELRGWLWESYFMVEKNDPNKINDVNDKIRSFYQHVADELNLYNISD